jgi:hypothetical protein
MITFKRKTEEIEKIRAYSGNLGLGMCDEKGQGSNKSHCENKVQLVAWVISTVAKIHVLVLNRALIVW